MRKTGKMMVEIKLTGWEYKKATPGITPGVANKISDKVLSQQMTKD